MYVLYSEKVKGLVNFDIQTLDDMYGSVIADAGLTQLRIARQKNMPTLLISLMVGGKDLEGATQF